MPRWTAADSPILGRSGEPVTNRSAARLGGYRVSSGHRAVTLCNGESADLVLDRLSPWAKAITANIIELPGPRASIVLSSADALGERVLAQPRGRSGPPAPRGANAGGRQATSGDNQPWFVQLGGSSGHVQPRAATWRMRLKSGPAVRPGPLTTTSEQAECLAGLVRLGRLTATVTATTASIAHRAR